MELTREQVEAALFAMVGPCERETLSQLYQSLLSHDADLRQRAEAAACVGEDVIEAQRLAVDNLKALAKWCNGSIKGIRLPLEQQVIAMQTYEGEMQANVGDWIIHRGDGVFYPISHDIFEMTYEPVLQEGHRP